ncbi:hypothetical protein HPB47_006524 [Ixodes persulcatus]|uniref:Uncharacterized protein n=1 Tax=Ixodes persulcatus TaxID=34615 RepID=A0AC60PA21_IXOPE|nr:hypothetical protein HPB47_006524 [Ixodes persulcatus]
MRAYDSSCDERGISESFLTFDEQTERQPQHEPKTHRRLVAKPGGPTRGLQVGSVGGEGGGATRGSSCPATGHRSGIDAAGGTASGSSRAKPLPRGSEHTGTPRNTPDTRRGSPFWIALLPPLQQHILWTNTMLHQQPYRPWKSWSESLSHSPQKGGGSHSFSNGKEESNRRAGTPRPYQLLLGPQVAWSTRQGMADFWRDMRESMAFYLIRSMWLQFHMKPNWDPVVAMYDGTGCGERALLRDDPPRDPINYANDTSRFSPDRAAISKARCPYGFPRGLDPGPPALTPFSSVAKEREHQALPLNALKRRPARGCSTSLPVSAL